MIYLKVLLNDEERRYIMVEESQKDPHFAKKFIQGKLIQIAKESASAGISADVFEALVIALADELDFQNIINN